MTESKICTCPSGNGSLRHPCPAHPASVEQAGGERWDALQSIMEWTAAENIPDDRKLCLIRNAARAALAQPSPVSEALIYACKNLAQITSSDGSGHADIALAVLRMAGVGDDERERLVNEWKAARAWKPSPAQVKQAEAERPEVVARVVHSNPVVLDHCGPLNANDELMTVAQHAASVARWAEMFNRVEQERDAAMARVAELEKQEPVAWVEVIDRDYGPYNFHGKRLLPKGKHQLYAAPVAQTQHSVPEGWMLVECGIWTQEQVDEMQKTVARFRSSEFVDDRALAMAVADAGQCKAPEISLAELLAAAPGKEEA